MKEKCDKLIKTLTSLKDYIIKYGVDESSETTAALKRVIKSNNE